MNKYNPLWDVLRATTNSPNDVWKERHYERHEGIPKKLLKRPVKRYTIPVLKVIDIKDDTIYLVVQFCTDILKIPFFVIDRNAFTQDLKAKKEFVYAVNVRLCLKSEFKIRHRNQLDKCGSVKEEYQAGILNSALNIIRDKPRYDIISLMENSEIYKNMTKSEIKNIIYNDQFDEEELVFKGIKK